MEINKEKLEMIELEKFQVPIYYIFVEGVKRGMEHPEWLGDFQIDEINDLIDNGAHVYLFRYEENVIGSSFIIPAREKDILKFGLDFNYQETIDYGPQAVSEKVRGNGVQVYINQKMDEVSKQLGYKHVVTTVHPDNIYSINNILKCGFQYVDQKEFSRGVRNIYKKDI